MLAIAFAALSRADPPCRARTRQARATTRGARSDVVTDRSDAARRRRTTHGSSRGRRARQGGEDGSHAEASGASASHPTASWTAPTRYLWTPSHRQERPYWCGPATCQIITHYFGRLVRADRHRAVHGDDDAPAPTSRKVDDALRYYSDKSYWYTGGVSNFNIFMDMCEFGIGSRSATRSWPTSGSTPSVWPNYNFDHSGHIVPIEAFDERITPYTVRLNDPYDEASCSGRRQHVRAHDVPGVRRRERRQQPLASGDGEVDARRTGGVRRGGGSDEGTGQCRSLAARTGRGGARSAARCREAPPTPPTLRPRASVPRIAPTRVAPDAPRRTGRPRSIGVTDSWAVKGHTEDVALLVHACVEKDSDRNELHLLDLTTGHDEARPRSGGRPRPACILGYDIGEGWVGVGGDVRGRPRSRSRDGGLEALRRSVRPADPVRRSAAARRQPRCWPRGRGRTSGSAGARSTSPAPSASATTVTRGVGRSVDGVRPRVARRVADARQVCRLAHPFTGRLRRRR